MAPATGHDDAPSSADGEQRMRHGYTNATATDGRRVTKRYVGPDIEARQAAEVAACASLAGLLPVPPVLEHGDQVIALGFMAGTPGQDLLDELPEAVLHTVGLTARRLHNISSAALTGWSANPVGSTVAVHGDFGPQNMLFDPVTAEVTAVLDWELAHLGDPIEDLAWPEWIIRTHHPNLVWAIPALFDGYGSRPTWALRQAAMLAKCRWALDFVRHWGDEDDAGIAMWQQRIEATAAFGE